ncbi:MAG TPA: prolipoprotein diacylglyceryl transferase family protein [Methylomirabilota bacterium]|nr:prolipoprotein diacylglyceryl transferase family protein [Methylomirabilota bacterium]
MPIAAIAFDFDPLLRLGDGLVVRWQTVALALVIAACLAAAGVLARRASLRGDDLLYLAVGAVPGAVIGGRLGQLIVAPEAFAGGPSTLVDPTIGGLELGLGVVGGVVTAAYVGRLLGAPVGRWASTLAVPLLVAIGGGKLAMAVGGSGQGAPLDAAWSTAYLGLGPWGSLAPALPSHPSQLYEGLATLILSLVLLIGGIGFGSGVRQRRGGALLIALGGWAAIRATVSATWRDPVAMGPLPVAGVIAIGIVVGAALALVGARLWSGRQTRAQSATVDGEDGPSWPDPETRTQF